jgi:hypothetical protein
MDPLTAYDLAKFRMAEQHEQAARERLVRKNRAEASDTEHESSIWRRWMQRRLDGRVTLAGSRA